MQRDDMIYIYNVNRYPLIIYDPKFLIKKAKVCFSLTFYIHHSLAMGCAYQNHLRVLG